MALEHMVWLTPKAGVGADKMEEILGVDSRADSHTWSDRHFSGSQHHRSRRWCDAWGIGDTGVGWRFAGVLAAPRPSGSR